MKKFFRTLIIIIVTLMFIGTFVYLYFNSQKEDVIYDLVSPKVSNVEHSTIVTGKIEPRDEVQIKPQISGIISEINCKAGDYVRKGDIIAKIKVIPDASQLSTVESRVRLAEISLNQIKTEYNRMKGLYDGKFISKEEYEQSLMTYNKAV